MDQVQVSPKKIPVRHNGRLYVAGETFEIDRPGYERIAPYLEFIAEVRPPEVDPPPGGDAAIEEMDIDQLRAHAEQHGIDLGKATSRDGILEKIKEAEAAE